YRGVPTKEEGFFEPLHFLVVAHVANWYVHYLIKLSGRSRIELRRFSREVVFLNLVTAMFFVLYVSHHLPAGQESGPLVYFFDPVYFYLWTVMHFLASFRPGDYWKGAV